MSILEIGLYSLFAVAGVLVLFSGLLIIWRNFPRPPASSAALEALQRIDSLELTFAGFADQYELSFVRNTAKLGKLRRALARERGDDEDDETPPANVAPQTSPRAPVEPFNKASLWAAKRNQEVA